MTNPGPIWKCECSECNCEEAAIKEDFDIDAICGPCGRGVHRAEREHQASLETRKRIKEEEQKLKDRED
jgi:hypothetical protein